MAELDIRKPVAIIPCKELQEIIRYLISPAEHMRDYALSRLREYADGVR